MRLDDLFGADSFLADSELVDNLSKALTAGYGGADAPATRTQGGALQTESLDNTLRAVTWEYKHLKIWPIIPKEKAWNLVEQYNRLTGYGSQNEGGFFNAEDSSLPPSGDGTYVREVQKVRFLGTTRSVSHPATLVRTAHAPMMALQIEAGTRKILEDMEKQLFIANAFFVDPATGQNTGAVTSTTVDAFQLKYMGLDQQIRFGQADANAQYIGFDGMNNNFVPVYDLQQQNGIANVPDEDDMTELAYRQSVNFGVPTDFFCSLKTAADLSRQLLPKEWITPPGQEGRGGFVLTSFIAATGVFNIVPSRFLEPRRGVLAAATGSAPATPAIAATGTEADANSKLLTQTYYYRASAIGQFGESLAVAESSQAVVAGNRVTLTLTGGAGTIAYAVFRSSTSGSGWEFIGMVKDSTGNGGGATFRDAGVYLPGLGHGYLTELNAMNIVWKQLAPLLKLDLAVISPAYRWMQLLYGTPIVFAPLHHEIMDNIGRL